MPLPANASSGEILFTMGTISRNRRPSDGFRNCDISMNRRPRASFCSILAKLGRGKPSSQWQFTIEHSARGRGNHCFQLQRNRFIRYKWKSELPDGHKPHHLDSHLRWGDRRLMTDPHCGAAHRTWPPERGTMYLSTILPSAAAVRKSALVRAGSRRRMRAGNFRRAIFVASRRNLAKRFLRCFQSDGIRRSQMRCAPRRRRGRAGRADAIGKPGQFLNWLEGQWLIGVLEGRRLMSVFQPIVHTDDPQNIYAYECLLRGRTATGQWIMPDRLFSAARHAGLLEQLDSAARNTAVESAAQHDMTTPVFVNIYPNAIQHFKGFLDNTIAATQATGLSPHHFVFEFVESEEIIDHASFLQTLDYFRQQGFRVALDDVGAGYASLNVLVHVKPDFMKLDMGLIRDVDSDLYKSRVAAKLLELAQELQVKTVVEGIETVGEWEWSREHGADFAQGYLFARPDNPPPPSRFWGTEVPSETLINGLTVGLR